MNPNLPFLSILAGTAFFAGSAEAVNVIVNSDFDAPSGNPVTTNSASGGNRTIAGWGVTHLYNHAYNGTQGPKLSAVGNLNYGVFDDIVLGDNSTSDTYKGVSNGTLAFSPKQTVDLSTALTAPLLTEVANGGAAFSFSAWMAGYTGDAATADIVATRLQFFSSTDGTGTALQTILLDRGALTNQITTADKLINPGGANNTASESDTDYWALYEFTGFVPATALSLTVDFVASPSQTINGGTYRDWYADQVVVDIVPEPSAALLGGIGMLALLRRRRQS
jgi:hypothetical protein